MDEAAPSQDLRKKLVEFARQGGLLLTSFDWGTAGLTDSLNEHPRFAVYRLGKGRIAVAKARGADPYVAAEDAHMLMSRTHDLVRLHNSTTSQCSYVESSDQKKAVLHLINYSGRPGQDTTAWLARPSKPAQLWAPGAPSNETLETAVVARGIEIYLPAVSTYAAVELG
jgi:hypothetical protein